MGWDVVEIGLRHNLPVNNPFATAQEVAKRMKQNIRLVYRNEYEYDSTNNVVKDAEGDDFIELGKYEVNKSEENLWMIVSNYQALQIKEMVGMEKLRKASFVGEYAKLILSDLEHPFELYEIENDNCGIRIFKENVDLDIYVDGRWHCWEKAFHSSSQKDWEWLHDYRMQIYNRAKMFGCQEVIICSDQGPTEYIYDIMDHSADDLKDYARSFKYLIGNNWVKKLSKEEYKKNAKHITFSSIFLNQLNLSGEDFVEVIYDDFSDIDI